ncbi:MAG: YggS family pyridoxal phosphate-dependent enzyme [Clostridiales bacterium]
MEIEASILQVRENILKAQAQSPLAAKDILLLAVSKTVDVKRISEAMLAGIEDLGENRVQELMEKYDQLPGAKWHLIGHLQTNKVKYIIDKVKLIHSLDSLNLAEEINKRAMAQDKKISLLVQVNIADEDSKFGLQRTEVMDFLAEIKDYPGLDIQGLMTIGPFVDDAEEVRPVFRSLRLLSEEIKSSKIENIRMNYLSMGMTNDYQVAIQEGANIVRVGSGIFGHR